MYSTGGRHVEVLHAFISDIVFPFPSRTLISARQTLVFGRNFGDGLGSRRLRSLASASDTAFGPRARPRRASRTRPPLE